MKFGMKSNECAGVTAIVLATAALVFSLIGNFWCNYAYTPLTFTNTINASNSSTYNMYYGIWNYKYFTTVYYSDGSGMYATTYASCAGYGGQFVTPNTKWNSAKAFSIIAVCLGGIATIASCAALGKPKLWMIISMVLMITTLFQGLTFLYFSSNACSLADSLVDYKGTQGNPSSKLVNLSIGDECALAAGAKLGISATVFWFVSALAAALAGKKGAPEQADEGENVKQQEVPVAQPEEAVEQ